MNHERTSSTAQLSRRDLDNLIRRLKKAPAARPAACAPIPRRAEAGPAPLSFAQQRLWFLDQLQPGSPVYNVPGCLRLRGALDAPALAASVGELARRHETLRSRFGVRDGEPVQVSAPPRALALPVVDLAGVPGAAAAARLEGREARRPFDLARGPLLRATLLRLGPGEHWLLLTLHHVAADGWSLEILLRELVDLYAAAAAGRPSPLPELAIGYCDFAVWQRRRLAGKAREEQLGYWRRQLRGVGVLELPTDRPRPAVRAQRGAVAESTLAPASVAGALAALARRHDATLFMVLLATFQVLLSRYAGQADVAVASPIANRERPELEGLVGFFANTLVLRGDLSADPTFAELLRRAREVTLAAYEHQDLPFEMLVEELAPERRLDTTPLAQVALSFVEAPLAPRRAAGLEVTPRAVRNGTAKFDLTLFITRTESGLEAELEYDRDLFAAATAARLLEHLAVLLAGVAADPERRVSRLPLMADAERRLLLETWNATAAPFPEDCVHRLVAARAAAAPDAVAVVAAGAVVSYGELVRRAGELARALPAWGVGPETLAAVVMERSPEMIAAQLAVLMAGGAYVALDPASPADRLAYQLADSGAPVVLTRERLRADLGDPAAVVVSLDRGLPEAPASAAVCEASPENLAYVIYTSGSTGRPKGTGLRHAGLANLVAWHVREHAVTAADRASLVAGPGFDASVWEIWPYLCSGASLAIAPAEHDAAPDRLLAWLAARGITLSFMPTPLAEAVLAEPAPEDLGLRTLLTGGDRLHRPPRPSTPFALVNHYGPTENTVVTTFTPVAADSGAGPPPIGRPIANNRVYVLDGRLEPAPIGVPGELCAAGVGLARGYLRRPRLTAERFLPDSFAADPGSRLYATGDRVRYRADGALDFLGRLDHQVKVRGFRVELGEIEAVLLAQPAVREAAVAVQPPPAGRGDGRLVAYVAAAAGESVDAGALRAALGRTLPAPMVPAVFVPLAALPRSVAGKVDRRALPAPAWRREEDFVAPRTPLEEILAAIWRELLGVDRVGVGDNFFELGGHSLLATRMISRVSARCGVELPLRRLFEAPTVAALAAAVAAGRGERAEPPPLARVARGGELPASFAQERLWFIEQLQPGGAAYHVPAAVRLHGRLRVAALAAALEAVVERHEALRTGFTVGADGSLLQAVAPPAGFALPLADLGALGAEARAVEVSRWLAAEARRPFDLAAPPLIRALLLRGGRDEHVLLVVVHHIVADGWSMGVLIREVAALYRAAIEAPGAVARSPLPPLPVQYADYAVWQRRWLGGEALAPQLAWWRRQLRGVTALERPTDRPRPAARRERGANLPVALPRELSRDLAELSCRQGVTLYMTLLAAFATLLGRFSGQRDVTVGSPVAHRRRDEVEGLIGFFVNTLVLRVDLAGDAEFRELLDRVRDTALSAYAHQDVPFERLVEEATSERDLSRTPLFQVMLVVQNAPFGALRLPGVELEPLAVATGTAKFDLTLFLSETPDGLAGHLEYDRDLFSEDTVRRLLFCYETLLAGAAADPSRRLAELPLLAAAERARLLSWNAAELDYDRELTLDALFAERAARVPAAPALFCRGERLTYAELDARANRLAHCLRSRGVGPEVTVGICLDRGVELVVALLAVLKAGGAYVPLDPSYPRERLAFTLEDAGTALVVTDERRRAALPASARALCVDAVAGELAAAPASAPAPVAGAGNLAYLIYTSGSTGRPKAVAICHRSAAHMVHWARREYADETLAGVLAATSINFDLSVFELFVPLAWGGAVILAGDALALASLPERDRVTLVNTVPTAIAELVRSGPLPPSVRVVNLAGEPLRRPLVDEVYAAGAKRVLNLYGPSEDTTYSTWTAVPAGKAAAGEAAEPTIGRPLPGSRAYLLDGRLEPVPVSAVGELHLAGEGLARGYLGRPALTAERFVPDPFAGSGRRLYRTGDLGRYRADGELLFLGRRDYQVKVRGFRIELGEIETALLAHPAVRDAVVTAGGERGASRLVAYVTPRPAAAFAAAELRAHLGERLPAYMVPAAFVELVALPLLPNGKVDRKALPAPNWEGDAAAYVAPRTPLEARLAVLWSHLLGVERVGAHDSFFALGGHSLKATRLVSRLRAELGVEVEVRRIFEAPTLGAYAAAVAAARDEAAAVPSLERQPRGPRIEPSFAQERLWFLEQLHPGTAVYNMPLAVSLRGRLDLRALAGGLTALARRHETLRTRFADAGGRPLQEIAPHLELAPALVDLSALHGEGRGVAARLLAVESRRPFDLAALPLVRAVLLRLRAEEHVLHLNMHHVISDGWSLGVLVRELAAFYRAGVAGVAAPLPALPVQYADFARWQRRWLAGEVLERQLAYWRGLLADLEPLALPTDRPRPPVPRHRGATVPLALAPVLAEALTDLGRRQGMTLYMTLLAAFCVTLARTAGGVREVAVGSPVAGRNRREIEELIGFFVNTVVLRVDLRGDLTWRELLARVRQVAVEAQSHQDVPFEKVVDALSGQRDLATSPLFQVMFALQNLPFADLELPGLASEVLPSGGDVPAKFDLTVTLTETAAGLTGAIDYDRDLFDATRVERLARHYGRALRALADDPGALLAELMLLGAAERHQVTVEWRGAATACPRASTVVELFAARAVEAPDAVALDFAGGATTCAELDRRANRLAHDLRALGVGPETAVGLCLERSPRMVEATLAVAKAGGFYVPLDPEYPPERLAFMIADTGAPVLLVEEALRPMLPQPLPETVAHVISLDADAARITGRPAESPPAVATAESLAYVMYTSGSTGRPKGVAIPHRGIVRLVCGTDYVDLGSGDRVAQIANTAFDAATFEIWGALSSGAAVSTIDKEVALSPPLLAAEIGRRGVTAAFLTTALFNLLAREEAPALAAVRQVLFGGEAADPARVREVLAAASAPRRSRLLHVYGPTESTTYATWQRVTAVPPGATTVPIGLAVANTRIQVLDRGLAPSPIGVPGQLFIGGDGLARGYLARPRLTAERFVPEVRGAIPGERLYATGDLVRHAADGPLEFLGRIDQQVKIRGFRIEPGEVEAVLHELPAVGEAAVVVRQTPAGGPCLVAYVAAAGGAEVSAAELRGRLQGRLPEYMVPAAFVVLAALPLNPNGKVDRRALPAPQWAESAGYAAPHTAVEEVLAGIWSEVLGIERVGIHDGFFELGGHSLLATQVSSRIRTALRVDVPLRRLFEAPTVAELAAAVVAHEPVPGQAEKLARLLLRVKEMPAGEARRLLEGAGETLVDGAAARAAPPIRKAPRDGDLPLSFAQERLWFLDQLEPGSPFYNITMTLRVEGPVRLAVMARCLAEVGRRHETLRTTFENRAGRAVQAIAPAMALPFLMVDLTALDAACQQAEGRRQLVAEIRRPFDLTTGPLLRCVLFRLAGEHRISMTIHHIVADGWSTGVLMREIVELYRAFSAGEAPALPELSVQYADFAAWQRRWVSGEVLDAQTAYWRQRLAGLSSLELPTDRPRPAVETFRGKARPVALSAQLTAELKELGLRHGATLFMTLLAAFQALLGRYSGQRDVAVGSPIANRGRTEIEGLIGFFANTLVLRTDLGGNPTWAELLDRVRETTLGAYAHQDLPFEKLVEELQPTRDLSRNPLFQAMLVLQNHPRPRETFADLTLEMLPVDTGIAKFDLTLFWMEEGGRLAGLLEHNTDLFDDTTAQRTFTHYVALLESLLADAAARPESAPLLSAGQRHQVLREWNATESAGLGTTCVHAWVEEQVRRTPDAVAVIDGERLLSYRELNARANQLAHALVRLGTGPERLVGICVERSIEMVLGLLAVLKAGGAGVALDPAYPEQRLSYVIRDAGLTVLLVDRQLRRRMPSHAGTDLCLDADWQAFAGESAEDPRVPVSLDNPIYAIYTSGSTGDPKGILVTHRAFANLLGWQLQPSLAAAGARTVQFATFGFCVSFQEIFTSWCSGGSLVMAGEMVRRDVAHLAQFLEARQVERLHLPFAALKHLAEASSEHDRLPTRLREVISAGEQLQVSPAVRRLFERLGGCTLRNQYGASETHVVSDAGLTGAVDAWPSIPPVGRQIANVVIYLLDRFLEPVPHGVPGALYTSGRCDARGYLGDPRMTAEKFLPDPVSPRPGARMYRTGDLARQHGGGEIEYLGRIDAQVKIRGFRVELGEVETVLARDARVRDVAVVAKDGAAGKQLVAYVVLEDREGEEGETLRALRGPLRQALPEHMVPAFFVPMASLPLNANGKLDREALPVPEDRPDLGKAYVAPRTPVEEVLAGIWGEVLGLERIGVDDGFFELGGHSLLATQVIAQVRSTLRVDLPLRRLFEASTLGELAAAVTAHEPRPGQAEKLARLLLRVKSMSTDETRELLTTERTT
jgi:amino acid adenylation domain-containing protein